MREQMVQVEGPYIQLNQLLKKQEAVTSGGQAKALIDSGCVLVNGTPADAVRKKLYDGDVVQSVETSAFGQRLADYVSPDMAEGFRFTVHIQTAEDGACRSKRSD